MPLSKEDQQRIEQAAKEYAEQLKHAHPHDTETSVDTWRLDFQRGMEKEAAHWQPILSQKDEEIKELVEGLENAREQMILGNMGAASVKIEQLLTKHRPAKEKQPETQPTVNHGICKECEKVAAVKDYNGHGHWVCDPCYESLTRYFESEYQ